MQHLSVLWAWSTSLLRMTSLLANPFTLTKKSSQGKPSVLRKGTIPFPREREREKDRVLGQKQVLPVFPAFLKGLLSTVISVDCREEHYETIQNTTAERPSHSHDPTNSDAPKGRLHVHYEIINLRTEPKHWMKTIPGIPFRFCDENISRGVRI